MLPAEVAQLVEQWSEEPPPRGCAKLLDNLRLIPIFGVKEQWFQWSIVLECGGQVALISNDQIQNQVITFPTTNCLRGVTDSLVHGPAGAIPLDLLSQRECMMATRPGGQRSNELEISTERLQAAVTRAGVKTDHKRTEE
jgi:hypothetical protein